MRQGTARCDPKFLDFITWSVLSGVRLFQRVQVTPSGLVALEKIPEFDFAAIVPVKSSFSVLNVVDDITFPLKVSPSNFADVLPWWQDLSWGSFCFVAYLTRGLLGGQPRHLQTYLDILPFDPGMNVGKVADASQKTKEYLNAVQPLMGSCGVKAESDFHTTFRHAYCLFRRHGLPFWTGGASGFGHPHFAKSKLIEKAGGNGEIIGMLPVVDLARHSSKPNTAIGIPDPEMLAWLSQEKAVTVQPDSGYFVLQAQRNIEVGELLTVDKNAFFNFDPETFQAWFGFPMEGEATVSPLPVAGRTVAAAVASGGSPSTTPSSVEDSLFFEDTRS